MYISRFETQISRFFPIHFPNLKVWEFQRLEGLQLITDSRYCNCILQVHEHWLFEHMQSYPF